MSDKNGNSLVGKKNAYICEKCSKPIVTVDRDDGTTPFMTSCEAKGCGGMAYSQFYRVPPGLVATHEWYRASDSEARGMKPGWREHHDMGGLFLRRIPITMTLRDDVRVESDLGKAVKAARKEATGSEEPPAPKRGFA